MALEALIDHVTEQADLIYAPNRSHEWTENEIRLLHKYCAALMTDLEIAIALDRSEMAVHLKRERSGIPAVRNTPGWMSTNRVMKRLGMNDTRPIIGWIKKGLLLGRLLPQGSTCWMVNETSLRRFVTRPGNWPYFDIEAVRDRHLHRLIVLARERWGDEWLSTRRAADLVGVDIRKINLYIKLGRLDAVRTFNKDGRRSVHRVSRWTWNFVRKSQLLTVKWDYYPGEAHMKVTPRGLDWIRKALRMGWSASAISRSMKLNSTTICNWINRYDLKS